MTFSYSLPPEYIAQRPCHPADAARMIVVDRKSRSLTDSKFIDFTDFLKSDDLLIFNDSRVMPARLFGRKADTAVELLLLEELGQSCWLAIGKPLKRLKEGVEIIFDNKLTAKVKSKPGPDRIQVIFYSDGLLASKEQILQQGLMPIPPYIRNGLSDKQDLTDYQTIFAKNEGSIAAPTASLHFTERLFEKIRLKGCEIEYLTLHVGLSSIREIEADKPPESEKFYVRDELKSKIKNARESGRRTIAIGTTAVRALESAFDVLLEDKSETNLFIKPGFEFRAVDGLVTNFHMPNSTHLQLVEAFMGSRELIAITYEYALKANYRFLSYGDGMLII